MRNNKFFIGIIILSMMMMGAGYAAWTQGLIVNQSIDSGELMFEITAGVLSEEVVGGVAMPEPGYAEFDVSGDEVAGFSVTATDMYPGVVDTYWINAVNSSTMATKVTFDVRDLVDPDELDAEMLYVYTYTILDEDGVGTPVVNSTMSGFVAALEAEQIEPDHDVYIEISQEMPAELETHESAIFSYTAELTVHQFNAVPE